MTSKFETLKALKENPDEMDALINETNSKATYKKPLQSGAALNTRTYTSKNTENRWKQYQTDKELRQTALRNPIPFINSDFEGVFDMTQGLILVGAQSGHSKSTTAANVIAGFLRDSNTSSCIVISNEESSEAVYNRTACVMAKRKFLSVHKATHDNETTQIIAPVIASIIDRVEVVDDPAWDMTCIEDVQAVLEYAATKKVKMVLIDYLQTVAFSKTNPKMEPFQVSKTLGLYLKDYGKRVGIPIVVFAQLNPKSESADIMSRFQNDKTIYNHAFSVIELVPDFKNKTTKFVIHKDRFGIVQGKEVTLEFVDGRYESLNII